MLNSMDFRINGMGKLFMSVMIPLQSMGDFSQQYHVVQMLNSMGEGPVLSNTEQS